MKIRIEKEGDEDLASAIETQAVALVRSMAASLHSVDPRLGIVAKGLWKSETAALGRVRFQGLDIRIENPIGSVRRGTDSDGKPWATTMLAPYGFIAGTKGADGEEYDCYLGPDPTASLVYIVHQARPDLPASDPKRLFDESKAMLGFSAPHEALAMYAAHYNRPGFNGGVSTMPIDEFREFVMGTAEEELGDVVKATPPAPPTSRLLAPPELTLGDDELAKALHPVNLTGNTMAGDRAVSEGTTGSNIAAGAPLRAQQAHDTSGYREALESMASRKESRENGAPVIFKPRDTYLMPPAIAAPKYTSSELQAMMPEPAPRDPAGGRVEPETQATLRAEANEARPQQPFPRANPDKPGDRPGVLTKSITRGELGLCTLRITPLDEAGLMAFEVKTPKDEGFLAVRSLTAACDHVYAVEKGFADANAWRVANNRRKIPSGGGLKFWGLDQTFMTAPLMATVGVTEAA